jgi:phosphatidylglycerophosphate synthase
LIGILTWPNNLITLGRMVAVSAIAVALAFGWAPDPGLGAALFVLTYWLTDYADGWVARRLKKTSAFGETLDLLADRWCDIVLAAFVMRHASDHAAAATAFLLLRIAPEVIISRFAGAAPGLFTAAATPFVSPWIAARSMDVAAAARTIFFAWILFAAAPGWVDLLLLVPAAIFAGLSVRVLAELAFQSLDTRSAPR